MLAYGRAANANNKNIQIAKITSLEILNNFCKAIIQVYGKENLHHPTKSDIERLLAIGEESDFLGMLVSLECMHWKWKYCPTAWDGNYIGKEKVLVFHSSFY